MKTEKITRKEFDEIYNIFGQNLISFCIDYNSKPLTINTPNGPKILLTEGLAKGNEQLFKLRDSAIYRAQSLSFHLDVLTSILNFRIEELRKKDSMRVERIHLDSAMEQAMYLLDDITFNAISLFDYFAGMIGYILDGDHGKKADWKKVYSTCSDSNNEKTKFSKSLNGMPHLKKCVIKVQREVVKKLCDYRADIYHNKKDFAPGESSISDFNPKNANIIIKIPKRMASQLGIDENWDITDAAIWLASTACSAMNEVLESMRHDIYVKNQEHFKKIYPPSHPIWTMKFIE